MKKIIFNLLCAFLLASLSANKSHAQNGNTPQNILIAGGLTATYCAGSYLWESLKIKSNYLQAKMEIERDVEGGQSNPMLAAIEYTVVDVADNFHQSMREEKNREALMVLAAGLCITSLAFLARN
ncbi:MAG: hypothetical protein P4L31_04420 [Candidatus Babeliales bacterium]|nr:hypothetical protein [Candidatus Babeliales bacterium]